VSTASAAAASAIYEGTIRHRRYAVRSHEFRHRVALLYLDLDELPQLLGGRLVRRAPGIVRVRRRDYLGDPSLPLGDAVRERVRAHSGSEPGGPIRMLAQPRAFGHCFNPVSFYYCFTPDERLDAVLAQVTSTPWGERTEYVMRRTGEGPVLAGTFGKRMHVSPFMGMEQSYTLRANAPAKTLSVHIESHERGERAFDATLSLRSAPLTRITLARASARYPAATVRVLALIYAHALKLRLKGVPVVARPKEQP
jgi:uncharacterized protein